MGGRCSGHVLPTDRQASEIDGITGCGCGSERGCQGNRGTEITVDRSCHHLHPVPSYAHPQHTRGQGLVNCNSAALHEQPPPSSVSILPPPLTSQLPADGCYLRCAPARGPLSHVVALAATTWVGACSRVEMGVLAWSTCWSGLACVLPNTLLCPSLLGCQSLFCHGIRGIYLLRDKFLLLSCGPLSRGIVGGGDTIWDCLPGIPSALLTLRLKAIVSLG